MPANLQDSATVGTDFLTTVATSAIAVAAAPLRYPAFPVILPLSVIGGIALFDVMNELPLFFG